MRAHLTINIYLKSCQIIPEFTCFCLFWDSTSNQIKTWARHFVCVFLQTYLADLRSVWVFSIRANIKKALFPLLWWWGYVMVRKSWLLTVWSEQAEQRKSLASLMTTCSTISHYRERQRGSEGIEPAAFCARISLISQWPLGADLTFCCCVGMLVWIKAKSPRVLI